MATVLNRGGEDPAFANLQAARRHHAQAHIARHLDSDVRTIRRWEARQG